jgi:hypothetical protein
MRKILLALSGAAFLASATTVVVAQTQPVQTNPNTKVYAYKKTAPKTGFSATPGTAAAQQLPFENLPGSVPFGSPKWWEVMGRSSGGDSQ